MVSVVLQTSFLGDMVLTTPLIERLAREGPVHVVATPGNAGLLENNPAVASVLVFDKRRRDSGLHGLSRMASRLRAVHAQRAFMAQGSLRTAALAKLAGIHQRVGFDRSAGRPFCNRIVHYESSWHHSARLWSLASDAAERAAAPPLLRPLLYPGPVNSAEVRQLLVDFDVSEDAPLVVLAPGSAWETKRWPYYAQLADMLVEAFPHEHADPGLQAARIVVIGAASDTGLAEAIVEHVRASTGTPVINAAGKLSLLGSAALLAHARVIVTNDSLPLHLASAMNTATLALFGPTVPALGFGPLAPQSVSLGTPLPCRPCHIHGRHRCPFDHHDCMRTLAPTSVLKATLELARR